MTCFAIRYYRGKWQVRKSLRRTVLTALRWTESQGCDMLVLVDGARIRGYVYESESRLWRKQLWLVLLPFDLRVLGVDGRVDAAATLNNLENLS